MLSSPRNPPSKRLLPARSLRLTHHVKFSSSFWKARSSHSTSAWPARSSSRYVNSVAHACTGGLTSLKFHSYAGSWPRSEEHTSELQSRPHLVCRLLLEKKKKTQI